MLRIRSLVAVLLLLLAAGPSPAQEGLRIFELEQTTVDRAACKELAEKLVLYAQTKAAASSEYYFVGSYRKLVRIAFQLSPDDAAVFSAHSRIRNGNVAEAPKRNVGGEELMAALLGVHAKAREGLSKDDEFLAAYLCLVGLLIDPANETCQKGADKLGRNLDALWESALAVYRRSVPDGTVSVINGLVVSSAGMAEVGQVGRIVLTYRSKTMGMNTLDVRLLREKGMQMNVAMDEAVRYWNRVRMYVPLPHGAVELSFEDKFTPKEGPSAGAACAVLLRSFSDPFAIDPGFAMTGDVSVEGRVLPIGGTFAKIRGALMGGCKRVGIPVTNETDLVDAILVNGITTLAEIEVVGLETVDDAVALARSDRDDKSRKASEDFAALRPLAQQKEKGSGDEALAASIQRLTDSILKASPRHLSAKFIDLWNNRKLPPRLTLGSSLDAAHDVLLSYLIAIRRGPGPSFNDVAHETKTANIALALDKLRAVLPKLHMDAQKPAEKLEQCCLSIQRFVYLRGDLDKKQKKVEEYEKTIKDLRRKIERAQAERKSTDEINGLIKRHNQAVTDQREALDSYNKEAEERQKVMRKAIEHYNEFVIQVRTLTQDPKILEKLQHGK